MSVVSVHTDGGYPYPLIGEEVPSFLSSGYTHPFQLGVPPSFLTGAYPILPDGGTPIQVQGQDGGYPHPRSGQGGTPIPGQGVPPLGLDEGTPIKPGVGLPPSRLDGDTPHKDWMGLPPPHPSGLDGGTCHPPPPIGRQSSRASTCMRRAVCLLRSSRRTFLFIYC